MKVPLQMNQILRPAIVALVLISLITGLLYPAVITGIAQVIFPHQANGSLITDSQGNVIGSELIGQEFSSNPAYFWGRVSATSPAYNAAASSGSNLGPLNPALIGPQGEVQTRIDALKAADKAAGVTNTLPIPVDLVTSSASGLDPDISPAGAQYQVARIAALRKTDAASIQALVDQYTTGRFLGLFGESTVNVLELNLALDAKYPLATASK
ncbi:MAG TPA: potassium-transporting ATPase subunit KdpC [Phototrophicaceae bacterium]|nr:potassium-transporting ATPase subunit KdpC [Phototrophicaceae bacterium]